MATQTLGVKTVAVIGAGVSGVAAAIHLKREGLDVTVYERGKRAGGIWVFDEAISKDAAYPSTLPSIGDSPEYAQLSCQSRTSDSRQDSPLRELDEPSSKVDRPSDNLHTSFAPPGPCYIALKNNVSTIEMEMTCQRWKEDTAEFVPHHVMADYIADSAVDNGIDESMSFNTRVNDVRKSGGKWRISVDRLTENDRIPVETVEDFDAIVIATGHYHACNIPSIDGLAEWKHHFPRNVRHSKLYRRPGQFKNQNILLIGAGVSSMDIARDLGDVAQAVYQSSRGGPYDLPSHLLPDNGARISGIKSFDLLDSSELAADGSIPGTITLQSGLKLCNIHQVIVCTGYHVSFPFMRQYHTDGVKPGDADEDCLVTDGQQTHNLHKDIWYINDPTLAFVGVPYHVATFSCFEFQAMAISAVFSGRVSLPKRDDMRREYDDRLNRKGAGRTFHSLKGHGDEIGYVNELVEFVNSGRSDQVLLMNGHTQKWHEAYVRRVERQKLLFGKIRDTTLDKRVIDLIEGC